MPVPSLPSRERLKRVFRCLPVDRMPVRIWGVDPLFPRADAGWQALCALTEEYQIDLIRDWAPVPHEQDPPVARYTFEEREGPKPHLGESVTTLHTPDGPLTQIYHYPKKGGPGYVTKPFIQTVEDARRWLSLPQRKPGPGTDSYFELERRTGDRALLMVGLGEAMYTVQALMGSEVFGYWLMDERDLLHEMIDRAYTGIEALVKHYLARGVGDAYGWVGPELCIPPLASPRDFREFCFAYDKRICDLVHDAGKLVWVHCHGDMNPVLEDFAEMGVDCLNPIEPPPVGKLTLAEAKARVAGRMCLEGGVEDGDLLERTPDDITAIVERTVAMGKPGGGFILCPTSSPTTVPELNPRQVANYRAFVETGMRLAPYE